MENRLIPLDLLPIGSSAQLNSLNTHGVNRRRMLDLGFAGNTEIKALQRSPSGDPVAYLIRGTVIALRSDLASKILVEST